MSELVLNAYTAPNSIEASSGQTPIYEIWSICKIDDKVVKLSEGQLSYLPRHCIVYSLLPFASAAFGPSPVCTLTQSDITRTLYKAVQGEVCLMSGSTDSDICVHTHTTIHTHITHYNTHYTLQHTLQHTESNTHTHTHTHTLLT